MKDVYVEWMVSKKRSLSDNVVRVISVTVSVVGMLLFALTGNVAMLLVTALAFGFTYFAFTYTDVEYEYIFVSGDFSIDRILSKSKRKRVEKFDAERIEIIAPLNAPRLGGYANKKYREFDYSSGIRTQDSHIFVMYCEGKKIIFEPNRDLITALKDALPQKVYMD